MKAFMKSAEFTEDFTQFVIIYSNPPPQQALFSWPWSFWISLFPLQAYNFHVIIKLQCLYYENNENEKHRQ